MTAKEIKQKIEEISGVLIALVGLGEAGYLLYKQYRAWKQRADEEEARAAARAEARRTSTSPFIQRQK